MSAVLGFVDTVFWGVLTFSLLIVLHEGGHYLAARLFGVRVHEFMIGLPGPALRIRRGRTAFGITAVPLGGYVRIAGMEPGEEDPDLARALEAAVVMGTVTAGDLAGALGITRDRAAALLTTLADYGSVEPSDRTAYRALAEADPALDPAALLDSERRATYRGKSPLQRIAILSSGVVANIVAAILVFTVTLSVWGYYTPSLRIAEVQPGSAAARSGVLAGDRLVAMDGRQLKDWSSLLAAISGHRPGDSVGVTVRRGGTLVRLEATLGGSGARALLGVSADLVRVRPSVLGAARESLRWTGMVFVAILDFFRPSTFARSVEGARSVVGISVEVARAVKQGPLDYAWLVALLSLSLGIMNVLPIPPLDGGKIAMEIVEAIHRRPLRREVSLGVSAVGAVLLFSLIGYLMYADVMRYVVRGG
ncbi:MAG: M50 family metallopeptidase [Coriobacteriia bacterium]